MTPLPLVERLSCKTCDNFQGNVGDKDADGFPTAGKCRRNSPDPLLTETSPQIAIWPTVAQTDVCGHHTQESDGLNTLRDFSPNGRTYFAYYYVSPITYKNDGSIVTNGLRLLSDTPVNPSRMQVAVVGVRGPAGSLLYNFTINKPIVNYTCRHCRFFKEGDTTCHRNPPEPVTDDEDGSLEAVWPTVDVDDWCGQGQIDAVRASGANLNLDNTPRGYADPK